MMDIWLNELRTLEYMIEWSLSFNPISEYITLHCHFCDFRSRLTTPP